MEEFQLRKLGLRAEPDWPIPGQHEQNGFEASVGCQEEEFYLEEPKHCDNQLN